MAYKGGVGGGGEKPLSFGERNMLEAGKGDPKAAAIAELKREISGIHMVLAQLEARLIALELRK